MRGRRRQIAAIAVAVLLIGCSSGGSFGRGLVANPPDIVRNTDEAVFTVDCAFSHRAMEDPIVKYGKPGASHSHDFFGNAGTDAWSTAASLTGGPTTCEDKQDTASYWAPTLYADGAPVDAMVAHAYYRAVVGSDASTVAAPPHGLKALAGNAHAMGPQSTKVVGWGCGFRPLKLTAAPDANRCSVNSPLTLQLFFPDCWDGTHLDSPDHRAHMAYSSRGRCPSSHPVSVLQLQLTVVYPLWNSTKQIWLGSGPTFTAHGDFFNTWVQSRLEDQVETCIRAKANCEIG